MTSFASRIAGVVTFLEGAWFISAQYIVSQTGVACFIRVLCGGPGFNPMFSVVGLGLGAAILVVGALGMWGARFAFLPGALLSAVALGVSGSSAWGLMGYSYLSDSEFQALIGAGLAAAGLVLNLLAYRARSGISEQANPMNLPVFG